MKKHLLLLLLSPLYIWAQGEYPTGILTHKECMEKATQFEKIGDFKEATRYLNTAAIQTWEAKDYLTSITYFNQSIELNKKINNQSGISKINSNLGMIYSDMGDFAKSLSYFQASLDYRLIHGEKTEIISTYINQGVVLNNLKRYPESVQSIEQALKLATEMNDAQQMKSCYGMLSETYEKMGDREKTIHYFNLYRTFHEMIQRTKVNSANKEAEAAKMLALNAELEKKEKELQLMNAKRELVLTEKELNEMSEEAKKLYETNTKQQLVINLLERENEIDKLKINEAKSSGEKQRIWTLVAIIGLVGAFAFAIMQYKNYKEKHATNNLLAEQNEEIKVLNENLEKQVQKRTSELQGTLKNLEVRNQELDQFSYMISHNLRSPVSSILGLSMLINKKDPADPFNNQVLEKLVNATKNLDAVVKDLNTILDVKDNQSIKIENVAVKEALEVSKNMLRLDSEEAKATIDENIQIHSVLSSKPYLESIIYNLLSNSIKYRSPERACIIEFSTRVESGKFVLSVRDNGIGIRPENQAKIFEPYKRMSLQAEGKGLGLYMVKIQAEAMKGFISVESTENIGSTFSVHLPLS
jgi:signal transduction histidine kinase